MLEDDEMFCHECGAKQEIKEAGSQVEEQVASEGKKCIHCGVLIEADSMFCPFCGKSQAVEEEKPEEPQQEPVKAEPKQSNESEPVASPQPEQAQPEEEPTIEEEEKKKSKTWLWILLVLMIAGGAGWYFLSGNNNGSEVAAPVEEVADSEVEESDYEGPDDEEYESGPSTKLAFLEKFYQEGRLDADYIKQKVTPLVLDRLRKAYGGDCKYGECLGTWVFLAFPQGADAKIVDGPFISETSRPGIFKVDYVYSYYKDSSKSNETRTVYLTVIKYNEDYLISDFEVEGYKPEENNISDEDEIDIDDVSKGQKLIDSRKYNEALNYLMKAADDGNSEAMFTIGRLYEDGLGVNKSYSDALSWYKKAAELSNPNAIFYMGYYYEQGLGGPQNYTEALKWYKKAADLGNEVAMHNIGIMYLNGSGVEKDRSEAIKWMRESAKYGDSFAKKWLNKNGISF